MESETSNGRPEPGKEQSKGAKNSRLSSDGAWRSFSNVPNLLQYVSTGAYYGRVKVGGKIIRQALNTAVFTTAKLRLHDFLKKHVTANPNKKAPPTFLVAKTSYLQALKVDPAYAPKTKAYKEYILNLIERTWPGLDQTPLDQVSETDCVAWAGRLAEAVGAEAYNHTLGVFRGVFRTGVRDFKAQGGDQILDPSGILKRVGVKPKRLMLPEPEDFKRLVECIAQGGGGYSRHCADLVLFLSYTGCRISEAKQVTWKDVDWARQELTVNSVKQRTTSNASPVRRIPINPSLRELLQRLSRENPPASPDDPVCQVHECQKSLDRACAALGLHHLTHHDFRHLFATRCIESGVDIPTVSRWLGHKDGGALAMRTYGHLRNQHSKEMAAKVKF